MFSSILTMQLKPNHVTNFIKTIDETVLPLLRKQEGFKDAIFFADKNGAESMGVTLWARKEDAEAYATKAYPHVLQSLTPLIEGTPHVQALNVLTSTFHKTPVTV